MLISDGVLVKGSNTTLWEGTPAQYDGSSIELGFKWASYGAIYRRQLWTYILVNKLARAHARLPLKVYERGTDGRPEARGHPYAELLRRPSKTLDPFTFWEWTASTFNVYGEVYWRKVRDQGGRPVELLPTHPTKVRDPERRGNRLVYRVHLSASNVIEVDEADLVPFRTYNPDSITRGLSPMEPLRSTLENEDFARRATSAFWRKGARPGYALSHPGTLSDPAQQRLKSQFDSIAGGADNTGATVVLEEGMKPEPLTLTAEEAQYIETRKLNREEVCGAFDVPPPVVHILDNATYSNITEQMRSMYRDTMAPRLNKFEAVLATHLRGSIRKGASEPDFGDDVYAEFLMDEVLRGDFEARQEALSKADYMTIAEKRRIENLPFIEGTDRIVINAASIPLDSLDAVTDARVNPATVRTVMGRLSRAKTLDDVDPDALVEGLNGASATVLGVLDDAKAAGDTVAGLRDRVKNLEAAHG